MLQRIAFPGVSPSKGVEGPAAAPDSPAVASHNAGAGGVINGKFYVATNARTTLSPIPKTVRETASAVIDGKLYVFGGNDGKT